MTHWWSDSGQAQPYYERQSAEECGLCALRNVLAPYRSAKLPTWPSLVRDARALEEGEEALISSEEALIHRKRRRCRRCAYCQCTSCGCPWCCCCSDDSDGPERADEDGNFSVEVLMRAAARQEIAGQRVAMEYWGGRHRVAAEGRELGFILGSGEHWWCIRRCGEKLDKWEEVDSFEEQVGSMWATNEALREHLMYCQDTVLVLYNVAGETASLDTTSACEDVADTAKNASEMD
mmetsp:Transcript_16835/g.22652  ORF Transcript_16835/g.22652 Transcript_16835/m.22652 type:complete len:235 (-) Transcript_16835:189-893(-)